MKPKRDSAVITATAMFFAIVASMLTCIGLAMWKLVQILLWLVK